MFYGVYVRIFDAVAWGVSTCILEYIMAIFCRMKSASTYTFNALGANCFRIYNSNFLSDGSSLTGGTALCP